MIKRLPVPPASLWEQVADSGGWCLLDPDEDYDPGTPTAVIKAEVEAWAAERGLTVTVAISRDRDNAPENIAVKIADEGGAPPEESSAPLRRAVTAALRRHRQGLTAKALLAQLDEAGHGHLAGEGSEHARAVRLGRMLANPDWTVFFKSRVLNGSRLWTTGSGEGTAVWNPRTRVLKIEFDDSKPVELKNVADLKAALASRDVEPIPPVHRDPETGVETVAIRER